jgi:hypothetical protein
MGVRARLSRTRGVRRIRVIVCLLRVLCTVCSSPRCFCAFAGEIDGRNRDRRRRLATSHDLGDFAMSPPGSLHPRKSARPKVAFVQ